MHIIHVLGSDAFYLLNNLIVASRHNKRSTLGLAARVVESIDHVALVAARHPVAAVRVRSWRLRTPLVLAADMLAVHCLLDVGAVELVLVVRVGSWAAPAGRPLASVHVCRCLVCVVEVFAVRAHRPVLDLASQGVHKGLLWSCAGSHKSTVVVLGVPFLFIPVDLDLRLRASVVALRQLLLLLLLLWSWLHT